MAKGLKYDSGKLRYDLIPTLPMRDLAEVYTVGAGKYDDNNWRKGIKFTRIMGAVERHIAKYKNGQDIDDELMTRHLAHAIWGCMTLLEFSRTHKELDDRPKKFKRIGYDIDGVVCNFIQEAINMCKADGIPCPDKYSDWIEYSPHNWEEISNLLFADDRVYRNAPAHSHSIIPEPKVYITIRRKSAKEATNLWFAKNQGVPLAPIEFTNTIMGKVRLYYKYKLDLFIEDTVENFDVMRSHGCRVKLIRRPWNDGHRNHKHYIEDLSEVAQDFEEIY